MKESYHQVQWASEEASRCLFCFEAPCVNACPARVDIPQFIRLIRWRDIKGAKKVIKERNYFGGICGYVCPSEELCEKKCVYGKIDRPIRIVALQKFACDNADFILEAHSACMTGKRVAVIGAGPAGLSCTLQLREYGHEVEVFEKELYLAGTVTREIPSSKIPKDAIDKELKELGVEKLSIHLGVKVTDEFFRENIEGKFDAIFVATGLTKSRPINLNGRELGNVFDASAFLSLVKQGKIRDMRGVSMVIGGGNTAIDCANTTLGLGAQRAIIAYRRTKSEMPADETEFIEAVKLGVEFMWMVSPVHLNGENKLTEVVFQKTRPVAAEAGGKRSFAPLPGSEFVVPANFVVFALGKERGNELDALFRTGSGCIPGNNFRIGSSNIFAGGDCVNHTNTVVEATAQGRNAAIAMHHYLMSC
jgi:glutamate synthase (NADPH/NADH) small chain